MRSISHCWSVAIGVVLLITGCEARRSNEELLQAANESLQAKRTAEAQSALTELLDREPDHALAHIMQARIAHQAGRVDAAIDEFLRVPAQSPQGVMARTDAGLLALTASRGRKAEECLLAAQQQDASYVEAAEHLLQLYLLQRRTDDIRAQLRLIQQHRPLKLNELMFDFLAGENLTAAERSAATLELFCQHDPQDFWSGLALARAYAELGRSTEALRLLKELPHTEQERDLAAAERSQVLLASDPSSPDLEQIWQTLRLTERLPTDVWQAAGDWLLSKHRDREAVACFCQVVRRTSFSRVAFQRLSQALRKCGLNELAQEFAGQAALLAHQREEIESLGQTLSARRPADDLVTQIAENFIGLHADATADLWAQQAAQLRGQPFDGDWKKSAISQRKSQSIEHRLEKIPEELSWRHVDSPLMRSKTVSADVRPALSAAPAGDIYFVDEQRQSQLDFQYFAGASDFKYISETLGGGVGVIDFDQDGWPDLWFPQGARLGQAAAPGPPDQLIRNLDGQRWSPVPSVAGVGDRRAGNGIAIGDLNNDGFDDVLIANFGRSTLFLNHGDGTFEDHSAAAELLETDHSASAGFADFDRDGVLDVFVANYVQALRVCRNSRHEVAPCAPASHAAQTDRLYVNQGDGRFAERGQQMGLVPGGMGLGLVLADLDDDGWIDAFVANDTTPNFLYRNRGAAEGRRFVEQGIANGVALSPAGNAQAGMGVACRDLNGDRRLDLYVTYFHNEPNGFYANQGFGLFQEVTAAVGLIEPTRPMLGFGTQALDADLNGSPELIVANGHIDDQRATGVPWKMRAQYFVPDGRGRYTDRSRFVGDHFQEECLGRGVALLDWNRDGLPDVVINHLDRPPALLTNKTRRHGHSVEVLLHGTASNRSAIGAKVIALSGSLTQRLDVTSGDGYACSNSRRLLFGIGEATQIDRLTITWPNGRTDEFLNIPAQTSWFAIEGQSHLIAAPVR